MTNRHQEIRTYTFDELAGITSDFTLKSMEDIYKATNGVPDSPHKHSYYAIIFIEKGKGKHFIDFTEYTVENATIYFIQPGQMHQLVLDEEPKGWVISFTENFLLQNQITCQLIKDIFLFNDYGQSPPLPVHAQDIELYKSIIGQIQSYTSSLNKYVNEAAGALVKLFLIKCNNHCSLNKADNPQLLETGNHILRNFKQQLEQNFATLHKVSDYAERLNVTPDYLNKTVKSLTGESAKDHIQSRIIIEAKRSLLFTDISNKELSFTLGFDESAHFNNFFKKITGQTPSEFRVSVRNI